MAGQARLGRVRSVEVWTGQAGMVRFGLVRHGLVRFGEAWIGQAVLVGRGMEG